MGLNNNRKHTICPAKASPLNKIMFLPCQRFTLLNINIPTNIIPTNAGNCNSDGNLTAAKKASAKVSTIS